MDLYAQIKDYERRQATKFPTSGTVQGIDGGFVDVLVTGSSTILRHVKVVGTPSSTGQQVVLSWENGTPTAHITGGSAGGSATALVRGPQGLQGEQGPAGPTGAQGPEGPAGSLTASSPVQLVKLASAPANPPAGSIRFYPKTDDKFYQLTSAGVEKELRAGPILYTDIIGTFLTGVTIPFGTTYYSCPYKPTADANQHQFPWPEAGSLSHMNFRLLSTQVGGTLVVTLQLNNVDTALVITVPAGAVGGTYSNAINTVAMNANDTIKWKFVNNGSGTSGGLTAISMKITKQT